MSYKTHLVIWKNKSDQTCRREIYWEWMVCNDLGGNLKYPHSPFPEDNLKMDRKKCRKTLGWAFETCRMVWCIYLRVLNTKKFFLIKAKRRAEIEEKQIAAKWRKVPSLHMKGGTFLIFWSNFFLFEMIVYSHAVVRNNINLIYPLPVSSSGNLLQNCSAVSYLDIDIDTVKMKNISITTKILHIVLL